MKRIIELAFLLVSVWVMVACSGKSDKDQGNKVDTSTEDIRPGGVIAEEAFDAEVSYANWTDDKKVYTKALNGDKLGRNIPCYPIYRFDTLAELEQFKVYFGDILTMDGGRDEVPAFNDVTAKYDDKFFEEKSVLLVYVEESSGSPRYGVNSVYCDGKSLCVFVEKVHDPIVKTDDMAGWFVTVAIPDSMIENCINFNACYYSENN